MFLFVVFLNGRSIIKMYDCWEHEWHDHYRSVVVEFAKDLMLVVLFSNEFVSFCNRKHLHGMHERF